MKFSEIYIILVNISDFYIILVNICDFYTILVNIMIVKLQIGLQT